MADRGHDALGVPPRSPGSESSQVPRKTIRTDMIWCSRQATTPPPEATSHHYIPRFHFMFPSPSTTHNSATTATDHSTMFTHPAPSIHSSPTQYTTSPPTLANHRASCLFDHVENRMFMLVYHSSVPWPPRWAISNSLSTARDSYPLVVAA